jgi:Mor family transcriptional regulator
MKYSEYRAAGAGGMTNQQFDLVSATFEGKVPDVWREIAELNFAVLRRCKYFAKQTDACLAEMAVELVCEFVSLFGGGSTYIPNGAKNISAEKNALILREFSGYNYRELANKYCVTQERVRQIVKEHAKQKKAQTKGAL